MHIRLRSTTQRALFGVLAVIGPWAGAAEAPADRSTDSGAKLAEVVVTGTSIAYSLDTRIGTFLAEVAGSRKLKMRQQFGDGGEWFDVLNTVGINTTFPSNEFAARLNLACKRQAWSANLFVNYAGGACSPPRSATRTRLGTTRAFSRCIWRGSSGRSARAMPW